MYVRELKDGMLIKPIGRWEWAVYSLHDDRDRNKQAAEELKCSGVHHHSTVTFTSEHAVNRNQGLAVYIGKKVLKNNYYGVKTQHLILVDGITAAMDGYSFRDVEKV